MTNSELFELKDTLSECLDTSSTKLAAACKPHKMQMGLISDEYKRSEEYKRLSREYAIRKAQMQSFWKLVRGNKEFAKADRERTLAKRYANVK